MRNRARSRQLRQLVAQRIQRDPELVERHQKFAWTRFWFVAGKLGVAFLSVVGALLLTWVTVLFGVILIGVTEFGESVGVGAWPKPSLPPLFAGWSLLVLCFSIITGLRIRSTPVNHAYKPWAVVFPVPDSKLIGPLKTALVLLTTMVFLSLGAFVGAGVGHEWTFQTYLRLVLVVMLAWWNAWMLAEWIAKLVPLTPLVTSVTVTSLVGLFILALACAVVPRDIVFEVNYFESFGVIWSIPPAGWALGITGLIEQPQWKQICMPIAAIFFAVYSTREFLTTLAYKELGLGSGAEIFATRQGWVESWQRARPRGELAKHQGLDRVEEAIGRYRAQILSASKTWWQRLLFPMAPNVRDIACLRLLRVNYPRRGRLFEFAWGLWPVFGAVSLLQLNFFMPLAAMPRFLRIYVAIFFLLSMFDFREAGPIAGQSNSSVGYFSTARALFPFNMGDIFRCLLMNRVRFFWAALPGWILAIGLMLLTDLPRSMVWNTPILVLATCLIVPVYSTISSASSNLLPTWRAWFLFLIPWSTVFIATFIALLLGVYGSLLTMRPDRAWLCLGVVVAVLGPAAFFFARALEHGKFDETVVPTNPAARKSI